MSDGTTHIVGAGLAGLAAAVSLLSEGRKVVVHELARHAGGRCRSFYEPALQLTIDNGNHLLLSGNRSALAYAERIGGHHLLTGPKNAEFPFCDLKSGERWVLKPNAGLLPWWIFSKTRRVPGTGVGEYLGLGRLLGARRGETVSQRLDLSSALSQRLMHPVLLAALNCELTEGSAVLAAAVIRETLARGGTACRPLIASEGLGPALVDPAIAYIEKRGGTVRFDHALRGIEFTAGGASKLNFEGDAISVGGDDSVILAMPGWVTRTLVPGLEVPTEYRSILNAHFAIRPPDNAPKILGVINATTEWLFAFPDRLSVTVSAADRFNESEREPLIKQIWREVAQITRLDPATLPPWQIVKERRATFAATPKQDTRRPDARTASRNLFLAGDWTQTGLPATIEGAIRSGNKAAKLAMEARV
jgi:hydroxysqualene dehydroxylase